MNDNKKIETYGHKNKHKALTFVCLVFTILIALLLYFAFYNETPKTLTGISVFESSPEKTIFIEATLTNPKTLNLKEEIKEIEIRTKDSSNLIVGKQNLDLPRNSKIFITNFNGDLKLQDKNINELDGKASKVSIDGLPISQESGDMKIKLKEPINYETIKLTEVSIPSLSYNASGKIKIEDEKITINLNDEEIKISYFKGNITLGNKLILKGFVDESKVLGLIEVSSGRG